MDIKPAPDVKKIVSHVVRHLPLVYVNTRRIVCVRTKGATSRARARIWSFPRIWQMALDLPAHYVIEVLSQHFDHLSPDDQTRVIIHELMHIPKNFSGAVVPHRGRYHRIDALAVEKLFQAYKQIAKK